MTESRRPQDRMTTLKCFQIYEHACPIVPARPNRDWMDATSDRYAYRCLPLSIANSMGWELLLPGPVTVSWNGGKDRSDVSVSASETEIGEWTLASSHFGHGILTFHIGYLFRTDPGVGLWARGCPNTPKDGIAPLEGIIETDWLNFTFTMNWQFTRPGEVRFAKDEPFCFITPVRYHGLDDVTPEILPLESDLETAAGYRQWSQARTQFNEKLAGDDPAAVGKGWQKWYTRGEHASGDKTASDHISRLRLANPVSKSSSD